MDTSKFQRLTRNAGTSGERKTCRVCGSSNLYRYLDLGRTPLANSNIAEGQLAEQEFQEELTLQVCLECGLSQLTKVVDPDLMFKNYLYVSSTPQTFRDHCEELAATAISVASAGPGSLALDIASNDGCLLSRFRSHGMNVLGVDPAENLAAEANAAGIRTLPTYWSSAVARDIVSRFGRPAVVTATNVLAHVDDVHGFVAAVEHCLAEKGIFIVEAPYLLDFITKNEFDTAYHEHLSYLSLHPLVRLMDAHGMMIFDVDYFGDLHGGSIRIFAARKGSRTAEPRVEELLRKEDAFGIRSVKRYDQFAQSVRTNKKALRDMVYNLVGEGKTLWAYGASAKGNTLMNFFELGNNEIPVVIDDNPKKWGYYTPGSHMKIVGIDALPAARVDYLLLLAWNFEREIRRRCEAARYKGRFIVPVPEATIISPTDSHEGKRP